MLVEARICSVCKVSKTLWTRSFSTSGAALRRHGLSNGKPISIYGWRKERDIPPCATEYGPLSDLPDFRFEDGRPAPLSRGQRNRLNQNEAQAQRISFLLNEVDSAVNTHRMNQQTRLQERQAIIEEKLMEKGKPFPLKLSVPLDERRPLNLPKENSSSS
ncbi:hypothetical protein RvY_14802 [Ramazzottius varieornatus]|uniref:Large ribosomal subunit protein mL52 n=1 Tax=Ramazzottius varieornatus TaxID=947166 RepID=A0A1D1VZS0_RAMVA|nr:hypothetical protein RvY_14802 [Ramazzottius varieornatus]